MSMHKAVIMLMWVLLWNSFYGGVGGVARVHTDASSL